MSVMMVSLGLSAASLHVRMIAPVMECVTLSRGSASASTAGNPRMALHMMVTTVLKGSVPVTAAGMVNVTERVDSVSVSLDGLVKLAMFTSVLGIVQV